MRALMLVAILSLLVFSSCAGVAPKQEPASPKQSGAENIQVGGEIKVRGQYQTSD